MSGTKASEASPPETPSYDSCIQESLVAFLHPTSIYVLMAFLVGLLLPQAFTAARFNHGIFLAGITLPRIYHKTSVNDFSRVKYQSLALEILVEMLE